MLDSPDPCDRWYTRTEAAAAAGVSIRTIQRWILEHRLAETFGHVNAAELFEVERERRAARTRPAPGCAA